MVRSLGVVRALLILVAVALVFSGSAVDAQVLTARKVVVSGGLIPGGGGTFCTFVPNVGPSRAQIGQDGKVVFRMAADDGSECGFPGLWAEGGPSGHSPILRSGDPAPGIPGVFIWALADDWVYGGSGIVGNLVTTAWLADSNGDLLPPDEDSAVFLGNRGGVQKLFRESEQAPGFASDVTLHTFSYLRANSVGQALFLATLRGPGIVTGTKGTLWTGNAGGLQLIVREGDSVPGGGKITAYGSAALRDLGGVTFAGGTDSPIRGLWQHTGSTLQLITRDGDNAFGDPSHTLSSFSDPSADHIGGITVHARVDGTTDGIWTRVQGTSRRVAIEASAAPGGGFYFTLWRPSVNAFGRVAFKANLSGVGSDDTALFAEQFVTPSAPTRIAIQGEHAPGTEFDTEFSDFSDQPVINALDQVVFWATLTGPQVDPTNDRGIWIWEPSISSLVLLAREGSDLEITPGDTRTVDVLEMRGYTLHDGLPRSFTERGEVLFAASFTDGATGILVARGEDLSAIFADGFEDGDTGQWSSVTN